MDDLLDGHKFYELMWAYHEATRTSEIVVAVADVKNYIRIHCVVPQGAVVIQEQDKSVPW